MRPGKSCACRRLICQRDVGKTGVRPTIATCDPVDVGVLEVVGRDGPVGGPAGEPDKLLATVNVVDDGGGGVGRKVARGGKLSNLGGNVGISDDGRVVPQTSG